MAQNIIIGQAARGDDYFPRTQITGEIWDRIEKGGNLLLVAPRRVGKSSILFNLLDEPKGSNLVVYYICESVNNENEFYRKLYHHILDKISGVKKYMASAQTLVKDFASRVESVSAQGGIEIGSSKISYLSELNNLIRKIEIEDDRIVVLVDEFAQAVENIIQDESERAAIHFLQTVREVRQAPETHKKLQFIYAGSIGLENIVGRMNASSLINDLVPVHVSPLNKEEAKRFVDKILAGSSVSFTVQGYEHLLRQIEWWIPFYFQVILDEVMNMLDERKSNEITPRIVDDAIEQALSKRTYFEQWFTRLRKAYKGQEFSFVKEILNVVSETREISAAELHDLAVKHEVEDISKELVGALKHDGYINNNDDPKIYRFNSPLLREWWRSNVAE